MRLAIAALAAAMFASPALAQEHEHPQVACTVTDETLPAGLEEWKGRAAVTSAAGPAGAAELALGKGYQAGLKAKADVAFAVEPEKPGGSVSHSGVFAFNIEIAGDYAVALGSAAWIDVVEDGKALEPKSFGHGPQCTTIRKLMVYTLKPGRHLLQIAGNGEATTKVLVARQP
jgi:hypothetical protein